MTPDVLIYGDTLREPALRQEIPVEIDDVFVYAEIGGERIVVTSGNESARLNELTGIAVRILDDFELREPVDKPESRAAIYEEAYVRAVRSLGIKKAVIPPTLAVGFVDRLRRQGVELTVSREFFADRRRVKSPRQLDGICRAQRAADLAMAAAAEMLRQAHQDKDRVVLDRTPLTSERLKTVIATTLAEHGCVNRGIIVARGAQTATTHDEGSGTLKPDEPVLIDIWPQDMLSGCYTDMTRTFVVGEPAPELVAWHDLVQEALEAAVQSISPGVSGRALYDATCALFEHEGLATLSSISRGEAGTDGFFHGLGHGIGLELHEAPALGLRGSDSLVAGDVIAIEPGLYRPGFGGVRLEDAVLVTNSGSKVLTNFPHALRP